MCSISLSGNPGPRRSLVTWLQAFRRLLVEEVRAHLQQAQEELAQGAARDRGGAGGRSDRDGGRSDRDGGGAQAFAVESVQRRSDLHHIDAVAESFDMCAASCWSGIGRVQYVCKSG